MSIISKTENTFFSTEIRLNSENNARAWVFLLTCFGSGISCFGLIAIGFINQSHTDKALWLVALGHLLVLTCSILLRYSKDMTIPSWCIGAVATAQLVSASLLTGGLYSNVIYVFPILPIFLVFIGGGHIALISSIVLGVEIVCVYLYPNYNVLSTSDFVHVSTMLWAIGTGTFISVIAMNREKRHQEEILERLAVQQKMQEQILKLVSERDLFWAMMSHELRNSLSVLFTIADLLEYPHSEEKKAKYLHSMKKSCDNLHRLLEQVLDFSHLESTQFSLQPTEVEIKSLLTVTVEEGKLLAKQKGLKFIYSFIDLPAFMYIDDLRLQQVLSNLIHNAFKYTQEGTVSLRVYTHEGKITFIIEDTGPGIPEDVLSLLFIPYRRGPHKQRGVGLGLVIVNIILKHMNSELVIDSTENGTKVRFVITFPSAP